MAFTLSSIRVEILCRAYKDSSVLMCGNKKEAIAYLPVKPFFLFLFFLINSNKTYSQCVQKRPILWLLKRVTVCS